MVYDFVTNIYTRPELGEHILVGGLDAEEAHDLADPDRYREGVSLDESTEALARVSQRFPVLADGRIARGYAGCFDVTPDWHPILDRVGPEGSYVAVGFSGHGFKLSPAVGQMMAALIADGPGAHPDLADLPALALRRGQAHPRHLRRLADVLRPRRFVSRSLRTGGRPRKCRTDPSVRSSGRAGTTRRAAPSFRG